MKIYFKKTMWFILGFLVFLAIEGVFYYSPTHNVISATGSASSLGGVVFILWAIVLGFISARKNRYNWAFIIGANMAYVLVSFSLNPIFISVVIFSLWQYAFRGNSGVYLSNDCRASAAEWNAH